MNYEIVDLSINDEKKMKLIVILSLRMRRIIDIGKTEDKEFNDPYDKFYLVTWREEGKHSTDSNGNSMFEFSFGSVKLSPDGLDATISTDQGTLSEISWRTCGETSAKFVFLDKIHTLSIDAVRQTAVVITNGACSLPVLWDSYHLMDDTVENKWRFVRRAPVPCESGGFFGFGDFFGSDN